jgi:hypothetical protein
VAFAATDERFAPMLRKGEQVAVADTARLVAAGIERGLVPPGDPQLGATAMIGVTTALTRELVGTVPITADRIAALADAAVRFCLGGLLADASADTADGTRRVDGQEVEMVKKSRDSVLR